MASVLTNKSNDVEIAPLKIEKQSKGVEQSEFSEPDSLGAETRPSTAKNRYMINLSTIAEQLSQTSLAVASRQPSISTKDISGVRRRVSHSLDENMPAKPKDKCGSTEGRQENMSSWGSSEGCDLTSAAEHALPDYSAAFQRSSTPPGQRAWPGDQQDGVLHIIRQEDVQPEPPTLRTRLRAFRDTIRTTTPANHGQTAFSRDYIQSTRSRSYWRPPRNTFNHRGHHPFQASSDDTGHAGDGDLKATKSSASSNEIEGTRRDGIDLSPRGRDIDQARYTIDGTPIYDENVNSLQNSDLTQDNGRSTIRAVPPSPQKLQALDVKFSHQVRNAAVQERSTASPHVRFEDFPQPPSEAHCGGQRKTIRSAALGSLLPVAAANGIARPVKLAQRSPAPVVTPSPYVDIARLYNAGQLCRHKAPFYTERTLAEQHEILSGQLALSQVDGVGDVDEKSETCMRCILRQHMESLRDLILCGCPRGCAPGLYGDEQQDRRNAQRQLPAWNNV